MCTLYSRAEGITVHYWPWAVFFFQSTGGFRYKQRGEVDVLECFKEVIDVVCVAEVESSRGESLLSFVVDLAQRNRLGTGGKNKRNHHFKSHIRELR